MSIKERVYECVKLLNEDFAGKFIILPDDFMNCTTNKPQENIFSILQFSVIEDLFERNDGCICFKAENVKTKKSETYYIDSDVFNSPIFDSYEEALLFAECSD